MVEDIGTSKIDKIFGKRSFQLLVLAILTLIFGVYGIREKSVEAIALATTLAGALISLVTSYNSQVSSEKAIK